MQVVLLAGGKGTRLTEETDRVPKPMVEIGNRPIIWHIMKGYAHYGFSEFIICCGYKGEVIKNYFTNYCTYANDITVSTLTHAPCIIPREDYRDDWTITMVDTGEATQTTDRIIAVEKYLGKEPFMVTYADGVGDVNIPKLLDVHYHSQKMVTLTAVQPSGKFGVLHLNNNDTITEFNEKPKGDTWVNAGFMVMEHEAIDIMKRHCNTMLEQGPLVELTHRGKLGAYRHTGFWKCMDTLRDRIELEEIWSAGNAPWRIWDGQIHNANLCV